MNASEMWHATRDRIKELVADADPSTPVPACPAWTVKDVIAHQAGVVADVRDGRLEGMPGDEWTARQVEERRDRSLEECLAEWDENASYIEPVFDTPFAGMSIADITSHEHDLRGALGRPGHRDGENVRYAVAWILEQFDRRARESDMPALRVLWDEGETVVGEGDPEGTLKSSAFELLRVLLGRRSEAQGRAMDWDGDPERWFDQLFVFGPAEQDIIE